MGSNEHQFIFTLIFHNKNFKKSCDDNFEDFMALINKIRKCTNTYEIKYGSTQETSKSLESETDFNDLKSSKDNKVFLIFNKNEGISSLRNKMKIKYRMDVMKKALSEMNHKRYTRFNQLSKQISLSREMIKFTPMKPQICLSGTSLLPQVKPSNTTFKKPERIDDSSLCSSTTSLPNKPENEPKHDHKLPCDKCNKNIIGERFLCAICNNYNLCSKCKKEKEIDHEHHFFISILNSTKFTKEKEIFNRTQTHYQTHYQLALANNSSFDIQKCIEYGTQGDQSEFIEIETNVPLPSKSIKLKRCQNDNPNQLKQLGYKIITYIRVDLKDLQEYEPGNYCSQFSIMHQNSAGKETPLTDNQINLSLNVQ